MVIVEELSYLTGLTVKSWVRGSHSAGDRTLAAGAHTRLASELHWLSAERLYRAVIAILNAGRSSVAPRQALHKHRLRSHSATYLTLSISSNGDALLCVIVGVCAHNNTEPIPACVLPFTPALSILKPGIFKTQPLPA